ncbi:hypothetical protein CIRMBP1270_01691 [Enterococcus cecorum]|nr:hypothetical protein CIRMBP1303_00280 [Enterococcus cecorum]CAI3405098.1 hypothetical protein CIRMBP1270_01691 [Enterococcus cecorum]CAI3410826.1 hypothetical protein CIRMBP1244_01672 [Enterococcus cecorum]CAI3458624.1 hypothetical protein CIRMBP1207_02210 [Enterococcus cecorum]CAI3473170.1 hypothetical protein CIRMBP1300_01732 [Enterococcus cecorum]
MKLIRLTHSVTEKSIYVDFDEVAEDIIERKGDTLIWQGTHAITVKESPEQIAKKLARKLAKQTKEM